MLLLSRTSSKTERPFGKLLIFCNPLPIEHTETQLTEFYPIWWRHYIVYCIFLLETTIQAINTQKYCRQSSMKNLYIVTILQQLTVGLNLLKASIFAIYKFNNFNFINTQKYCWQPSMKNLYIITILQQLTLGSDLQFINSITLILY